MRRTDCSSHNNGARTTTTPVVTPGDRAIARAVLALRAAREALDELAEVPAVGWRRLTGMSRAECLAWWKALRLDSAAWARVMSAHEDELSGHLRGDV